MNDQMIDALKVAPKELGKRVKRRFADCLSPIDTRLERHRPLLVFRGPTYTRPTNLTRLDASEHRLSGRPVKGRAVAGR